MDKKNALATFVILFLSSPESEKDRVKKNCLKKVTEYHMAMPLLKEFKSKRITQLPAVTTFFLNRIQLIIFKKSVLFLLDLPKNFKSYL